MWNELQSGISNQDDQNLAQQWRARRESPSSLEAKLVAEFRVEHQVVSGSQYVWWALAAAALVVLVVGMGPALFNLFTPRKAIEPILSGRAVEPAIINRPSASEPAAMRPQPIVARNPARQSSAPARVAQASKRESYTEFFPINNSFSRDQLDRGQVIRVQLPRSALFTIGMPVDVNRLDESIKADLVMGEDGMARAVRFVQ